MSDIGESAENDYESTVSAVKAMRRRALVVGLLLAVCLVASLAMTITELDGFQLPGCGSVSHCTRATQGRWGKLPGLGWPLSFVGFAYFQSLAAALMMGSERLPFLVRATMLASAIMSLILIGAMLAGGYLCGYCLIIHVANLALAATYLRAYSPTKVTPAVSRGWPVIFLFVAVFALTSGLLATVDAYTTEAAAHTTRLRLTDVLMRSSASDADDVSSQLFERGRYVRGAEGAKTHVTVVSDYQCPSCRRIDAQLRAIALNRDDISISARHFPFCADCNDHIDKTLHENACRAAVAAEAAGIAGGAEAFWQMHDWLFEHAGQFTDEKLLEFIRHLGINEDAFRNALVDQGTIAIVRNDVAAADDAGLKFTPTIFINGRQMELSGSWSER